MGTPPFETTTIGPSVLMMWMHDSGTDGSCRCTLWQTTSPFYKTSAMRRSWIAMAQTAEVPSITPSLAKFSLCELQRGAQLSRRAQNKHLVGKESLLGTHLKLFAQTTFPCNSFSSQQNTVQHIGDSPARRSHRLSDLLVQTPSRVSLLWCQSMALRNSELVALTNSLRGNGSLRLHSTVAIN